MRVCAALVLVSCAAPEPRVDHAPPDALQEPKARIEENPWLTEARVQEDVELLIAAMETVHPGYDRYANPEFPEILAAREAAVAQLRQLGASSMLELHGSIARYVATLRCGQTFPQYPQDFTRWRSGHPSHLPFRFVTDGERLLVKVAAMVSGLSPGDEILAIGGEPVESVIDRVTSLLHVEGLAIHSRPAVLESSHELAGSGLDHYLPVLFGTEAYLELKVRRLGGSVTRVRAPLVSFAEWQSLVPDPPARDFSNAVNLDFPLPGVALLRIETFENDRNPVDPAAIYRTVVAQSRGRGVATLILDLRNNGGGSDGAVLELLRVLAREPFTFFRSVSMKTLNLDALAPHLRSWDARWLRPDPERFEEREDGFFELLPAPEDLGLTELEPRTPRFEGDVILLTSARNGGVVAHLAAKLVSLNRALLVGEPTGGSATGGNGGAFFALTLPNSGIRVRMPALRRRLAVDDLEAGVGVRPHALVAATLKERLAGRDPAMEHALALAIGASPPPRPPPPALAPTPSGPKP